MSFQERFKDKAQLVGKTGEGAMLVHVAPKPKPQNRTPSSAEGGSGRVGRSLLPSGEATPDTTDSSRDQRGVAAYRRHIQGVATSGAGGAASPATLSPRTVQHGRRAPPAANELVERPHEPMKFGHNRYRNKDEIAPRWSEEGAQEEATYVPYTVDDWRRKREEPIIKGGVGRLPSDTDEQRLYRVLRGKVKDFSDETNEINRIMLAPENQRVAPKPLEPQPSIEFLEKTALREKAKDFARNVPKPRVREAPTEGGDSNDFEPERSERDAVIADQEERHRRDQEALAALRKKLAM